LVKSFTVSGFNCSFLVVIFFMGHKL
jgi:hypothetical protein